MRYVVYDIETRSALKIKECGAYRYAADPSTDVWCVGYCLVEDGVAGEVKTWVRGEPVHDAIVQAYNDPDCLIVSFNDDFERNVERNILAPRYGWPVWSTPRRRDVQAVALSYALPAGLDAVAGALGLPTRKSASGTRMMKSLAVPRKPRKGEPPDAVLWWDTPERLQVLYEYNRADVQATIEVIAKLGFLPASEEAVWQMDAAINDRGVCIDAELLDAALDLAGKAHTQGRDDIAELTGGEINGPAEVARIKAWLTARGVDLPSIKEAVLLEELERDDLPPEARRMLELRLQGADAATKKLKKLRGYMAPDSRVRGAYRYHGASTGRWTSVGVQLQNLKKPDGIDIDHIIELVRARDLEALRLGFPRVLDVLGGLTRALLVAGPGSQLFIADLSGIESRGTAWLCGETSKVEAWRRFDEFGEIEPYLKLGRASGVPEENARAIGKVQDLAFGYQGGLGAWRRLAGPADTTPDEVVMAYQQAWRQQHPNVVRWWSNAVRAAVRAIEHPGFRYPAAKAAFRFEGRFLHMELPSGRTIKYPDARVYSTEYDKTFDFMDASGGRWRLLSEIKKGQGAAFGGLLLENAVQALCRDIFVDAMLRLEAAGYAIVGHLHDEFIAEAPLDFGGLDSFKQVIVEPPSWAPDFPVATKGRVATRFIEVKKPKTPTNGSKPPPFVFDVDDFMRGLEPDASATEDACALPPWEAPMARPDYDADIKLLMAHGYREAWSWPAAEAHRAAAELRAAELRAAELRAAAEAEPPESDDVANHGHEPQGEALEAVTVDGSTDVPLPPPLVVEPPEPVEEPLPRPNGKSRLDVHFSSARDDWATPQWLFDKYDAIYHFDLDVAASAENTKCKRFFSKEDDALKQDWGRNTCWMNPPYARGVTDAFIKKAYEASLAGATVVCLIPARTSNRSWHDYVMKGEIEYLKGRVKFGGAETGAPFPSAIVVFRPPKPNGHDPTPSVTAKNGLDEAALAAASTATFPQSRSNETDEFSLGPQFPPMSDVVGDVGEDGKVSCPFHQDDTPSCHIYDDHFHCFGCGKHGGPVDWVMQVEEISRDEATARLLDWTAPVSIAPPRHHERDVGATLEWARELWGQGVPITGTLAEKYLSEVRCIDTSVLPDATPLLFHPRCPFEKRRIPALLAMFSDVETDAFAGIHRIALTDDVFNDNKVRRLTLGRWPRARAVKLWPAGSRLFVGEGIETVLAAATRLRHRDRTPMQPAWACVSAGSLASFPVVDGVDRLLVLVDHDSNGVGLKNAQMCSAGWSSAGRKVERLMPPQPGTDFNDIVKARFKR